MASFSRILLIGATHGVEPQSEYFARKIKEKNLSNIKVLACLNPWGLQNKTRGNINGVDLNRNMPSTNWTKSDPSSPYYGGKEPASEAETQALIEIIEEYKPEIIISVHTNHYIKNPNEPQINFDGPQTPKALDLARKLENKLNLPLTFDIGYPTPGSLGSYCTDKAIPCLTFEFNDELSGEEIWERYGNLTLELLK